MENNQNVEKNFYDIISDQRGYFNWKETAMFVPLCISVFRPRL